MRSCRASRAIPGKLQQVFLNLFLNARDAMESGGTLARATTASRRTGWCA